ncbi:MAG TPA: DUF1223 domain-containing protein [Rhizomicrobium sp.]|nr:DUF1223 domain-containing protein [Rhizomicrobium sp.]
MVGHMILRMFLGAALAAVLSVTSVAAGEAARPIVVELYTSQGCSSCPPADALLGRLAKRPDVLAMSLPITYWDMLGWKDTLANPENTARQKGYSKAMGKGGVYTPQIIVDGLTDVVGSRETGVKSAIAAREADMMTVPILLRPDGHKVHVSIGSGNIENGKPADATVWVFHILSSATVAIGNGENKGRTMTYRNVVRDLKPAGEWKGAALAINLPRHDPADPAHDALAVVVQQGGYGRVLGAAFISRPDYSAQR